MSNKIKLATALVGLAVRDAERAADKRAKEARRTEALVAEAAAEADEARRASLAAKNEAKSLRDLQAVIAR